MIAVMGATGHTGRAAAEKLLAKGTKIRAIARSAGKLSGLAGRGGEVAAGDFLDAGFLARAFEGAEGVYAMVAPDYQQPDVLAYYRRGADAIDRDVPIPMTATADIGAVAGEELSRGSFEGTSVRELLGPRDYTMSEATRILGAQIGKPDLAYVRFSDADYATALLAAGFSKGVAESFIEMSSALSRGLVRPRQGRTPQTTMPTTFESFAKDLAAAYRQL